MIGKQASARLRACTSRTCRQLERLQASLTTSAAQTQQLQEDLAQRDAEVARLRGEVEAVARRNAGSEAWSEAVELPCRLRLDTSAGATAQHVDAVLAALQEHGLL